MKGGEFSKALLKNNIISLIPQSLRRILGRYGATKLYALIPGLDKHSIELAFQAIEK